MSLEENKAIFRKAMEALNERNLDALDEFVATDCVDHALQVRGLEELKQNRIEVFKSFPDWHIAIEDLIAEGDSVWAHVTVTGTHKGEYSVLPVAPTGKKITESDIDKWRVVDGKIVEHSKGVNDEMNVLKQLGIIDYTEDGKKLFPG